MGSITMEELMYDEGLSADEAAWQYFQMKAVQEEEQQAV